MASTSTTSATTSWGLKLIEELEELIPSHGASSALDAKISKVSSTKKAHSSFQ